MFRAFIARYGARNAAIDSHSLSHRNIKRDRFPVLAGFGIHDELVAKEDLLLVFACVRALNIGGKFHNVCDSVKSDICSSGMCYVLAPVHGMDVRVSVGLATSSARTFTAWTGAWHSGWRTCRCVERRSWWRCWSRGRCRIRSRTALRRAIYGWSHRWRRRLLGRRRSGAR